MRDPPTVNATYKFAEPCEMFQNSEAFWSTVFSLLLLTSERPHPLEFPVNTPIDGEPWFEARGESWRVPKLDSRDVIVEGKSGLASFATQRRRVDFGAADFGSLPDLNSDLAVWDGGRLILVEVKTIRARLHREQVQKYLQWAIRLSESGCPATAMFLLSAGHENGGDHQWLVEAQGNAGFGGVVLWEDVFRAAHDLAAMDARLPSFLKSAGLLDLSAKID